MSKKVLAPSTMLVPLPAVLVTCGGLTSDPNIITISWCGVVCSQPPMLSISVREKRHSFNLIKDTGEYVVNITGASLVKAVDYCGNYSGKDFNKFKETGLTPEPATKVRPPLIKESPINLECQIRKTLDLGSHHIFIAEIVATHVDESMITDDGRLDVQKINPLIYATHARQYWSGLSKLHGFYGLTREKK
ncbi:MAG: flavin reductase family protein [candidate division Zixibacteria bacterium]|nr:flavin reductase family protein [candidate division Zixibacteria bacterium]